jgi:hypothetical protein
MFAQVKIKNGSYRGNPVTGIFEIVKEWKQGAKGGFVTVTNDGSLEGAEKDADVRVTVAKKNIEIIGEIAGTYHAPKAEAKEKDADPIFVETDEQTIARITQTFEYIETLASAAQKNQIRGLIISGPAGIGKSYGVEQTLNRLNFQALVANLGKEKFEIVTGGTSPIGLYCKLWENRQKGRVLVFDDCDTALYDDLQLNMLKAAMDTKKKRKICWMKESNTLDKRDIPNDFEFEGSVIFLTNVKFDKCTARKIAPHLEAIMSRVHYLDLCLDSRREQLLRVKQVVGAGMLDSRKLGNTLEKAVVNYVYDNVDYLKELSLRTVLKVADLAAIDSKDWEQAANYTVLSHRGRMTKLAEAHKAAAKAKA